MTTILIAEDSPTQAEKLRFLLEENNYNVVVAKNGKEALSMADEHKPSIILSDIQMPQMNGYELCKHIKSGTSTRGIPVILLTSLSDKKDVLEGIKCGADSFINKPYSSTYLITHVEETLNQLQSGIIAQPELSFETLIDGEKMRFSANPQRILSLFISTYEAAKNRNEELLKSQNELIKSEEKYHHMFMNAEVGIFISMLDGSGILAVNDKLCNISGYTREELLTKSVKDLWQDLIQDFGKREELITQLNTTGSVENYELDFVTKNKEIRTCSLSLRTDLDNMRIEGMALDITKGKNAEKSLLLLNKELENRVTERTSALQESESRFRSSFEHSAIGKALVSTKGKWLLVNTKLCDIIGYTEEELYQKTFQDITFPDDVKTDLNFVKEMLKGKRQSYKMEKRYIHKNGNIVWVLLSVSLVKDQMGEPLHFVSEIEDISIKKQAQVLEKAISRITIATNTALNLDEMFKEVHDTLTSIMPVKNFYIALYDEKSNFLSFPYFVDEVEAAPSPRNLGKGATEYILRTGQALFCNKADLYELQNKGEIEFIGEDPELWMGVPLILDGVPFGVIVVQDYTNPMAFIKPDLKILEYMSSPIAKSIQLKESEEELRKSERSLKEAQHLAQLGNWELDIVNIVLRWSDEVYNIFEIEQSEFLNTYESFLDRIHPEDREFVDKEYTKSLKNNTAYNIDHRLLMKDGRIKFIHEQCITIYNEEGEALQSVGTIQDITRQKLVEEEINKLNETLEQKVAELVIANKELVFHNEEKIKRAAELENKIKERTAELREKEENFRNLANNISQLAWMADEQGSIFWYNQRWYDYTGTTLDEMSGWGWQKVHHPDHVQSVVENIKHCFETGVVWEDTFPMRGADGLYCWFLSRAVPIRNEQGKVLRWFGTNTDITERKLAEEDIRKAKTEAEQANLAKSEFLANMSHEIRTPMNAVLGYADLLGSVVEEKNQKDYIESIKSSGKGLLILINDILDLSKIEAGKLELQLEFINSKSFFSEFERIFSFRISEKGIKFILDIASGTPAGISIDEARLRQILFNLIGNAVKFTEKGHIRLKVYTENPHVVNYTGNKSEELIDLIIEIEDTGIGISREFQDEIFEPFTQAHVYKQSGGTGLGLTITRRLVALMNGTIDLQSEEHKGSTFRVKIPEIACLRDFNENEADIRIDTSLIIFEKATVLIADDVEHNRKYLIDALKNGNITILEAEDGVKAFNMIKKLVPDLVITDMRMPKLNGFGLLNKIKDDKTLKHIPVIAYSASVMKEQKERIHKSEFSGLLIKPVQVNELFIELMNHLPYNSIKGSEPDNLLMETRLSEDITDLAGLIHSLETGLNDTWKTFATRQPIGEIKEFGNKLAELGKKHIASIVAGYGEELMRAADNFNIEAILKLIREYPRIIESLKDKRQTK